MFNPIKKFSLFSLTGICGVILITWIFASSCKKEKETENHCPTIAASLVPQIVKDSFNLRYPSQAVNTWFQKDSIGYCAYFIVPVNKKTLAEFSRTGNFLLEYIDNDKDGNMEDSTGNGIKGAPGCECDIPE